MINIMDIINKEPYLFSKIIINNNEVTNNNISLTCRIFNEKTQEILSKQRKEFYTNYIPKKIEEIINKKMGYIVKHSNNTKIYKKPKECDELLYLLSSKIIYGNYDIILNKLMKKYKDYSFEFYLCYNIEIVSIMYRILTMEYYNFITKYMYYTIENHEYNNQSEEMIVYSMNNYRNNEDKIDNNKY